MAAYRIAIKLDELTREPESLSALSRQTEHLRQMVFGLCQEVATLKALLGEQGQWDEESYRRLRRETMLQDHSSAGASPWVNRSHTHYLWDEEDFLREALGAEDAEVESYLEEASHLETLT